MNLSIQQLKMALTEANKLVENKLYEDAYKKYKEIDNDIEMMRYLVSETNEQERDVVAETYSSFAYLLFSFAEYSQFFEMYIKAQRYGYSFDKRRKFIYDAFIEPNIDNFKLNYTANTEKMKAGGCIPKVVEFGELPYWFITTGNKNEYYLYEKETDMIKEKFIFDINDDKIQDIDFSTSVSDYIIIDNGCWESMQRHIKQAISQGKMGYIITNNIEKLLSNFQGGLIGKAYLSEIIIFENIESFKTYFIDNNKYLPRHFIGSDKEQKAYASLVEGIHKQRLNKETRCGKDILLSICIPSCNRGKRAYENIIHTLQSDFDEEIEIVISNNGTKNESKRFYDKISEMEDSRVTYFQFEENQGMALNFCKVANLAKGKYILLLSDEDLLDLNILQSIVNILNLNDDNISIIRTRSDKQGSVPFVGMTKPGQDSLLTYMLTSNYMSGNIYNRELLNKHNLVNYIETNLKNQACLYYPHMVWELVLCQYGNVLGLNHILINEGQAEKTEFDLAEIESSTKKSMPYYATIEGRLGQHKGFYDVIKQLEISKSDFDIFRKLYKKLCAKTIFLVSLSNNAYYKQMDVNTNELLESSYNDSAYYLEEMYQGQKNSNKYKYVEDMKEIEGYYEHYKGKC